MDPTFLERLSGLAKRKKLSYLLVGGNAINLYGYQRTTFDADVLIAEDEATQWTEALATIGYRGSRRAGFFLRLTTGSHSESFPIDLMLVDRQTFEKLRDSRKEFAIGRSRIPVPAPLHLIALKLHAARNPERARLGQDIQDIMGLIDATGIDTQSEDFKDVINRYADKKTKKEILRRLGNR